MAKENMKYILGAVLVFAAIATVAMASPKGKGIGGFDEYGYNDRSETFNGCLPNYLNWKSGATAIECSETDIRVQSNWHFDKEDNLEWLINLWYYPESGDHYLKKYVTISKEECVAVEGVYKGVFSVTQTGENVPVCQIMEVLSGGDAPSIIATPVGFGLYKEE